MTRDRCICGASLKGLDVEGSSRFGFIPASSLAHYNYDIPFSTGVTLLGARVFERCPNCGALIECEYPTLEGQTRVDDPLITYGPGTVYEECDISSVPTTYRSFRALITSGVTGGLMYSGVFKERLAELYKTTILDLPGWKVVRDTILDPAYLTLDEWWSAAIGRNFIVLYENTKVLRLVAAWHRVEGTQPRNERIEKLQRMRTDELSDDATDTDEVSEFKSQLILPDAKKHLLRIGNEARERLIDNSVTVGRHLFDLRLWASQNVVAEGNALFSANAVHDANETRYGIWHAEVDTPSSDGEGNSVDMLFRHNHVVRVTCSCEQGSNGEICPHMVATALEIARHLQISVRLPDATSSRSVGIMSATDEVDSERYQHYADVIAMLRQVQPTEPRYEWLTSFIQPLKEPAEPLHRVEFAPVDSIGMQRIGYSVYSETVLSFVEALLHNNNDEQYQKVLHRYGLDKDVPIDILNADNLDDTLIVALLTMLVHKERRHEGVIAEALEDGSIVRLLERLKDVDDSRGTREVKQERRRHLVESPIGPRGLDAPSCKLED
ncbi:DNA-binding protein [Bifidobacterium dolichotidis]|uniref:DNA-binding protein n=2 Tax=Bifidobacterium dolichotidis TaxID=2306976 RepID=A0A430FTJ3_9BIFI|nr:DNA-binding protein [Bifidobacterium dolichotidis]